MDEPCIFFLRDSKLVWYKKFLYYCEHIYLNAKIED